MQAYEHHSAAARPASTVCFVTHVEEKEVLESGICELEEEPLVTAVDHAPRVTKEKRKAAFEGVIIPPYGKGKGKENQAPAVTPIVTHQMCLVLWTWRKLADETNAKNAPKIC